MVVYREKKRILLVDDEAGFTDVLKANLVETGRYEVLAENHGARACADARSFQPDVVLLDVIMPDVSGGEIAQQFRDDPLLCDIPIVFLTAIVSRAETGAQGRVIAGRDFLAKPVDMHDVMNCIERYFINWEEHPAA